MKTRFDRFSELLDKWAAWILIVMSVVGMSFIAYQQHTLNVQAHKDRIVAQCLANYNAQSDAQTKVRSQINADSDNAKTNLLKGVGTIFGLPPTTSAKVATERQREFLQLFVDFKTASDKVDADRAAHPLPDLPHC